MGKRLDGSILLLDGGTGTELDRRGLDVSLPIWSARALLDAPEAVEQIHVDYLEAGSGAIVTNTFRTHRRSLAKAGHGDKARELTALAVDIAKSARDRVKPDALILGSVAPLEDCYRPDLAPSMDDCRAEHAEMITHLLDAGVDYVLLETANTRHESSAAAAMANRLAADRWMISFCAKAEGPPGVLLAGTPLVDVLTVTEGACAVGINCMVATAIAPQVKLLRTVVPDDVPIAAYGNIGHAQATGEWVNSDATDPDRFADYAEEWIAAGATIIGGCCGTTPETIRAIAKRLG